MISCKLQRRLFGVFACVIAGLIIGCGGSGGGGSSTSSTATTASTSSTSGTGWTATTNASTSGTGSTATTSTTATTSSTSTTSGGGSQLGANSLVLYRHFGNQVGELCVTDPFGGSRRTLLTGYFRSLATTLDRRWILAEGTPTNKETGLYIMGPTGNGLRMILSGEDPYRIMAIAVSPTGKECAMVRCVSSTDPNALELDAVDLETGSVRTLLSVGSASGLSSRGLCWDPLNRFVLCVMNSRIMTVPPEGGMASYTGFAGFYPSMSLDGNFMTYVGGKETSEIRVANWSTLEDKAILLELEAYGPRFDVTGTRIYFNRMWINTPFEYHYRPAYMTSQGKAVKFLDAIPDDVKWVGAVAGSPN